MLEVVLTNEIIAVLGILSFAVILFVFELVRVDVAALIVLVLLGLSALIPDYNGLIPSYQIFQGFSSNAVMSIIAVMILVGVFVSQNERVFSRALLITVSFLVIYTTVALITFVVLGDQQLGRFCDPVVESRGHFYPNVM